MRCGWHGFANAPGFRVVVKRDDGNAVGGNRSQSVGGVVGVGEDAIGDEVAVGIVCELTHKICPCHFYDLSKHTVNI